MVDGTDVFEYFLCPYKVYNRHHRDKSLMLPLSDFAKQLMEKGRAFEHEIVSCISTVRPTYPHGDFANGFVQTLKLMQQDSDYIYQPVLKEGSYLGIPDLLIKQKGKSKLGAYHYIPADIKSSARSKDEQLMQLLFYNMLLEKIQGYSAKQGILILKNSSELIDLSRYQERFAAALPMIEKVNKGFEYGMHIDSVCKECPWRVVCVPLAEKTQDVSLVYGLSRPTHHKINEIGIKTLTDLQKADTAAISEATGASENVITRWKEQANVLLTKKAKIATLEFPKTKNPICLDIETAEDGSLYLIGLWHNNAFKHFFSENDEKKIIDDFIEYLLALEDYKLYHYGIYEKTVFKQLFEKYKIPEDIQKDIFNNMIDIFVLLKKHALLPLKYYNLKEVAKHFGFSWRAKDASGSNSMLWYNEWKSKKDAKLLKKILNYNEDDVKATYIVLQKLAKNE